MFQSPFNCKVPYYLQSQMERTSHNQYSLCLSKSAMKTRSFSLTSSSTMDVEADAVTFRGLRFPMFPFKRINPSPQWEDIPATEQLYRFYSVQRLTKYPETKILGWTPGIIKLTTVINKATTTRWWGFLKKWSMGNNFVSAGICIASNWYWDVPKTLAVSHKTDMTTVLKLV